MAYNVGDITQALAFYAKVLVLDPQHILAQMNIGKYLSRVKVDRKGGKSLFEYT